MSNKPQFDIAETMDQLLTPQYLTKQARDQTVAEVIVNLVKAADILENLKMSSAAEAITSILENIPKRLNNVPR